MYEDGAFSGVVDSFAMYLWPCSGFRIEQTFFMIESSQ